MDRNTRNQILLGFCVVVPYVGTWIEMLIYLSHRSSCIRRSLRGNVDRNVRQVSDKWRRKVVPYVGTWIEIQAVT